MATTSKSKQTCPASTSTSTPFGALKQMLIPLKDKEVKVSISKTNPECFELTINKEEQGTQIGMGFDLIITPLVIEFQPQETIVDSKSVPLQTKTPREQPTQQKTLDKEPQHENNSPSKVLLQNQPSAMQLVYRSIHPRQCQTHFLRQKQ